MNRQTRIQIFSDHRWMVRGGWVSCCVAMAAFAGTTQAHVVTLAMDVQLDQVAPEDAQMYRVGGHDLDRITYDDSTVDQKTHRVRVTSLSHYIAGHWAPTEPADASILDMRNVPYRLTFASSVVHGRPLVALFEGDTQRMVMLARPDFHVLIAGKYVINPRPLTAAEVAAPPPNAHNPDTMPMMSGLPPPPHAAPSTAPAAAHKIIALDVSITIDQVSPEEKGMAVGQHHEARLFYDQADVDPVTHRVALLHEQHTPALIPKRLNAAQMPMSNAWIDLSGTPIRYHFAAAPTVAIPFAYFILFDENTMRMTIRKQSDGSLLLSGPYTVNPKPITGPEIDAAVSAYDPSVPPWDTTLKFPGGGPGGPGASAGPGAPGASSGSLPK
jgi:hypothetical protein